MSRCLVSLALIVCALGAVPTAALAVYTIDSARTIPWNTIQAGLDPIGGIPARDGANQVTCAGLDATGATNMTTNINTCITNATSGQAVFIPAGVYLVTGNLNMKSNVTLRGAKAQGLPALPTADAAATTFNMNGSEVVFDGGSKGANWTPGINSGTAITAGYTKDSTSITVADAASYAINDVIVIYQNKDTAVIDDKNIDYLGEDHGLAADPHVLAQYTTITNKVGNVLTINPGIFYVTPTPTGESIRKQTFNVTMAGVENIRLNGNQTNIKFIDIDFCKYCWVKGVETYNVGQSSAGSPHIWIQFSMNGEFRDGYHHHGLSNDSGRNYGIEFYNWNSMHKIENNIIRETRHSIAFEGGGSGNVILYNYTDDNWESVAGAGSTIDNGFLSEDGMPNHGAHPDMNLWEGNRASCVWGDYTQGSSSHNTFFRNHFTGLRTNHPLDANPDPWVMIEVETFNRFYNIVGNVLGSSTFTTGTVVSNSAVDDPTPTMYRFGRNSNSGAYGDTQSYSTAIKHGNFDYVSDSVAHWDGGADHVIATSLYYAAKPAFFGSCGWPPFDGTGAPTVTTIPALERYNGTACAAAATSAGEMTGTAKISGGTKF